MTTVVICNKCGKHIPSEFPGKLELKWERYQTWDASLGIEADLCDEHYSEARKLVRGWLGGSND